MKLILRCCLIAFLFVIALSTPRTNDAKETKPEDRFAKLENIRVHYQNYGKGKEALVFVHGWTCDLNFWKANVSAFTGHTRVIAVDLPGHGQSDKPQTTYSMDLFARAINAVMEDGKVERATLVGHSMGTPVIHQFYRKYPAKTRALVVVDGGLKSMGTVESMKQFLDPFRGPKYKEHAEQMVSYLTGTMKDKTTQAEVKAVMLSAPQHVMIGAFEGMLDPAIWPAPPNQDKIKVPTLALMAASPNWNADYEKYVRELVPDIDYQVWPGVSHFLMMDEPQKFNEAVTAFLTKNNLMKN